MKFTNKQEYLTYRFNWKNQYKTLSQQIRNARFCKWYCSLGEKRNTPELTSHFQEVSPKIDWTYWSIYKMKEKAKAMLKELSEAKQESHRQYLLEKEQSVQV